MHDIIEVALIATPVPLLAIVRDVYIRRREEAAQALARVDRLAKEEQERLDKERERLDKLESERLERELKSDIAVLGGFPLSMAHEEELTVSELAQARNKNKDLQDENKDLQDKNKDLQDENNKLRERLAAALLVAAADDTRKEKKRETR